METENIRVRSIACQEALIALLAGAKARSRSVIVDLREVENYQERFDQWAGNLGAFHVPESRLSLEYRLRNNPIIRDAILRLLADLRDSACNALSIVSGKQENRTALPLIDPEIDLAEFDVSSGSESSGLSSSGENGIVVSSSEIDELISAIRGSINSLFKTSVFIRKFAPKERRQRAVEKADIFTSQIDEIYIKDRYPAVERKGRSDLVVRLGLANAHRRQYFMYCREHNDRLSRTDTAKDHREVESHPLGQEARREVLTTAGHRDQSFLATTTATDLLADNEASGELPQLLQTEPTPSLVSYATTIDNCADDDTAFPPLPADAQSNSLFLCPYCRNIVKLNPNEKEKHWRKHVLSDLEPYVCTYAGCSLDTYQSQHAWFDHELLIHRATWPCFRCGQVADTAEILKSHIMEQHADQVSPQQLPLVVEQSRRPIKFIHPKECPFCDEEWAKGEVTDTEALVVTLDQYRRHLGQHLQRIALFSLPRLGQNQDAKSSVVTGGTAGRSLISITTQSLGDQILEALVVSTFPPGSHQVYMPGGHLDELITEQSIIGELTGMSKLSSQDQIDTHADDILIEYILKSARKVFAISLICGVDVEALHETMKLFKSVGFDDSRLPIKSIDPDQTPWSQIQWSATIMHKFRQRQWMFLVPTFSWGILNVELEPHHILPFALTSNKKGDSRISNLWEVTIHEAHQEVPLRKFDNSLATAAVKAYEGEATSIGVYADQRWENQERFLSEINSLFHMHIVRLETIITWIGRGRFFIYKWPDGGNLRDFYASNPRPSLDPDFVQAIIQQLAGLGNALSIWHYSEAHWAGPYRQGILEPENIWRFEDGSRVGVMKLCGIEWKKNHAQEDLTLNKALYHPPEATLEPRSAQYWQHDMWSLGCILLELIMWLLYGTDELESFLVGLSEGLDNYNQYWVVGEGGTHDEAQVHPSVRACMDHIARDPECDGPHATAIADLLAIVRTRLLVIPFAQNAWSSPSSPSFQFRANSVELRKALGDILEKGKSISGYWYTGRPRDGIPGPVESISSLKLRASS